MMQATLPARRTAAHLRPYNFVSAALTHPGRIRTLNEDAYFDRPDIGLWAVADGMGGHAAGDVASATVIRALGAVDSFATPFAFRKAVRGALLVANAELQERAAAELLGTIGSTVVTLLVHEGHYACMWAGDSRAYLLRDGTLTPITRDHSLVQELLDRGEVGASRRQNAHIITRAVGAGERLDLDACFGRINSGDRFLLCSDGLEIVPQETIRTLTASCAPEQVAAALVAEALSRGAPDNVTCVVVECW